MEWIFDTSNMFTIKCMYILYRAFNTFNMGQLVLYEQKIKGYVEGVKSGVCGCIQSNVTHVRDVKSKLFHMLCTALYEQKFKVYVKGVKRDSKYTIRAVMLRMSKVSKGLKIFLTIF